MIINEHALDAFRRERLSPSALLELIERYVVVLIRLGIGVGKSFAADALLAFPGLYRRFDLVIYAAPTWSILREREILSGRSQSPVPMLAIRPRPRKLCGPLAARWAALEARSCSVLAKERLCRQCTALDEQGDPCAWPDQLKNIAGTMLVFTTEQQLLLNRSLLPMLRARAKARNVLLILDEAKLLDASFEIEIRQADLAVFRETLLRMLRRGRDDRACISEWIEGVDNLLLCDSAGLASMELDLPLDLIYRSAEVQRVGDGAFGDEFRFVAYDLMQLRSSRREERSKDHRGTIRFTARPHMHTHVLVLSAHLEGEYIGHRLGEERVPSPFGDVVVQHSGTRIYNLKSRIGADRYFASNKKQILDTIAVLIWRNISAGRTTLLISRKKSRVGCAEYLRERLRGWNLDVQFIVDGTPPAMPPTPTTIPFIHYGVLGVNDYTEYETAYCVNGYYVSSRVLSKRVQEFDPGHLAIDLRIACGVQRERRVEAGEGGGPDLGRAHLGNLYLKRLELDPVIQAAGRVRFLTRPREVVFFQMTDLEPEVGPCTAVASLEALRSELGIPRAKELDHEIQADRLRVLVAEGRSVEVAAAEIGMSRASAFRRLGESLRNPMRRLLISCRGSETGGGDA